MRVSISGAIIVPRPKEPVRFRVRISDVNDSSDDPYPVFCMIPDIADEDGVYAFNEPTEIPYQFSQVDDMPITAIPLFALAGPKKGLRRIRVTVAITPDYGMEPVFATGSTTFTFTQEAIGYIEIKERTKARERQIATLALGVSAADGRIDKRETAVIRRFFAERFTGRHDAEHGREKITQTLQETLNRLRSGQEKPSKLVTRLCNELREDGDPAVTQAAYELCVQIVAADEAVNKREQRTLAFIAQRLGLPEKFVREVQDRNVRLTMYEEVGDEQLVGMPVGLSDSEKREFLSQEYRKWRARVTHSDPKIAAEASLRLRRIAKLRGQLSDV